MGADPLCQGTSGKAAKAMIVVTGMGRSGSKFLSTLLNRATNAVATHELIGDQTFARLSYYQPRHPLVATTLREGFERISLDKCPADRQIAVEPGLRYVVPEVRKLLPNAYCVHLVRDGRAVVQSMYRRKVLTDRDPHLPFMPHDPVKFEQWRRSDRFGRLCWCWADSVRRLLDLGIVTIALEKLVSEFDYLDARLLRPAGIALSESEWVQHRNRRVNQSGFRLRLKSWIGRRPHRAMWSDDYERRFREICGDVMDALPQA